MLEELLLEISENKCLDANKPDSNHETESFWIQQRGSRGVTEIVPSLSMKACEATSLNSLKSIFSSSQQSILKPSYEKELNVLFNQVFNQDRLSELFPSASPLEYLNEISSSHENILNSSSFDFKIDPINGKLLGLQETLSVESSDTPSKIVTANEEVPIDSSSDKYIDEIIPESFQKDQLQNILNHSAISMNSQASRKKWAVAVSLSAPLPDDFENVVPKEVLKSTFPHFELDIFQKQAIYHLEIGHSVFVAAHTSAGKTAVAEYAINLASKHLTKAIYTSPIKALSNQKYRDFKNRFEDVGILTGDVQLNPEASCLIMTTEILRSMLYRGSDMIRDVEYLIFDEVHYVNDAERGVVWEEVIIMLPPHVILIMLSATLPNCLEFADWIGRVKKRPVYVVSTSQRPVPLEHWLWTGRVTTGTNPKDDEALIKIVDSKKTFLNENYQKAKNIVMKSNPDAKFVQNPQISKDGKAPSSSLAAPAKKVSTVKEPKTTASSLYRNTKTEKNIWTSLINYLLKRSLLPCVVFTFSKKKCEENVASLSSLDLTSAAEKSSIHVFIDKSLNRLNESDRELPQILRMKNYLSRGLAVHHSGLLPIMKEIVEILFSRNLIRVLFATETFAMGVNMPARTVVFSSKRKHDGTCFRDLLPGEYTQMSGRAGRRGLDPTGTVILIASSQVEFPFEHSLRTLILGMPSKLSSQFRLTYSMILNLLRVESLRVEDMIKRSFGENAMQRNATDSQEKISEGQNVLHSLPKVSCPSFCDDTLQPYWEANSFIVNSGFEIWNEILNKQSAKNYSKVFCTGRIIILSSNHLAVVLRVLPPKNATSTRKIEAVCVNSEGMNDDLVFPFSCLNKPKEPITASVKEVCPFDITSVLSFRVSNITSSEPLIVAKKAINTISQQKKSLGDILFLDDLDLGSFSLDAIALNDKIIARKNAIKTLLQSTSFNCKKCPDFLVHYKNLHNYNLAAEKIANLQYRLSDENLTLLPDYKSRVCVLANGHYIDASSAILLKGRVACELKTVHELVTTELIMENAFADFSSAETISLLSCMVFQEKSNGGVPIELPGKLEKGRAMILEVASRVVTLQKDSGMTSVEDIDFELFCKEYFKWGLVEAVHEWALGLPFCQIAALTDVLEGSIVRTIVRLDETCRELKNAAKIIGDTLLLEKMEDASQSIKRDICFATSLYI